MIDLIAGDKFMVLFKINDDSIMVETIFTGTYVQIGDDKVYILENSATGRPYGYTKKELDAQAGFNNPEARHTMEGPLTIG